MAAADLADLPGIDDIRAAAGCLAGRAVRTPLLESPALNQRLGGRILLKAECLQRTGSFKFRGAFNRLSALDGGQRKAGVVAFSSGNHAQGVASAAKLLGIAATIVMPGDAPGVKLANTRRDGAEIVTYDRARDSREDIAGEIARRRGAVLVPPFDDALIIAGQGTVGLELASQANSMGAELDAVLVPVSGGGLIAGCALVLEAESPGTSLYAVEPEGYDDWARSLAAEPRTAVAPAAPGRETICDALMAPAPGVVTFAINGPRLAGGLAVGDAAVAGAMRTIFEDLKLVTEPSGAIALAALLDGRFDCRGKTVVVVISGGNVDAEMFRRALAAPEQG